MTEMLITELAPNEVFVFESNLAGKHNSGAAKQAHEQFGAEMGVGEGMTGNCYAYPTLDGNLKKLTHHQLKKARTRLYKHVNSHPELTFLLTKVGCGIAGHDELHMRKLFYNAPDNIKKPGDWYGEL